MKIVFDIDGTLSDPTHRLHHILNEPKNWDAFFDACLEDTPLHAALDVCTALLDVRWNEIEFWTGRAERCRPQTKLWLEQMLGFDRMKGRTIRMRRDGDHRHDDVVKLEYLEHFEPDLIFEDRKRVVDAYRALGITVFQVAPGDF